jgi:hypothetical protein
MIGIASSSHDATKAQRLGMLGRLGVNHKKQSSEERDAAIPQSGLHVCGYRDRRVAELIAHRSAVIRRQQSTTCRARHVVGCLKMKNEIK